jgi:hypothetical protein
MEAVTGSQSYIVEGNTGGNSTGSCCDAMGALSSGCDFVVSQAAYVASHGGNEQVVNSDPIVRFNYIEAITPPPRF